MKMKEDICLGERDPQEAEALICLLEAEIYLGKAMLNDSTELYSKALEFSEKVLECFPRCAIAHYFAAVAYLKVKGDKNYAKQKLDLPQSIKSNDADTLAQKLKEEMGIAKDSS
jgi:hypothetical protein